MFPPKVDPFDGMFTPDEKSNALAEGFIRECRRQEVTIEQFAQIIVLLEEAQYARCKTIKYDLF